MKIMDEKGKLFGKINAIDLLVLVVILVALVVIGLKVFGGDKAEEQPSSSDNDVVEEIPDKARLTYVVRVTAQRKEVAEQLARYVDPAGGKKDQIMHGGRMIEDAYVVDHWVEPCRYNVTSAGVVEMIGAAEADAAGLVDICLVVEAIVPDATTNLVGSLEVRIGKAHNVKTTHFEFVNGFVTECEWESVEE